MKALSRSSCAAVAVSMLLVTGCGGDDGDTFPANSMEINGTISAITHARVLWVGNDWRRIELGNADGDSILFGFDDLALGDTEPANHYPRGTWTAMGSPFVQVSIFDLEGSRAYDSASAHSGSLQVGGTPGSTVSVNAAYGFTSEPIDTIRVKYSGPYVYQPD